jgi:membrane-bound lytic murein transglycosylase D
LRTLGAEDRVRYVAHEVAPRETLAQIARHYGTSLSVLEKVNDLSGPRVTVGETLKVPQISGALPDKVLVAAARIDRPETDTAGRKQAPLVYRVKAGETLTSIARRNNMAVGALARLNKLAAGDPLVTGQRLLVKAGPRELRDEGVVTGRRVQYTVRHGDTIESISRHFQVSVTQLKTWNGINQRHPIRAGRRLVMYVESNRQDG